MAQGQRDVACGFNLLATGHEAVKEKPKTTAARGSIIATQRKRIEVIFLCHEGRLVSAGTQSGRCSAHQEARSYKPSQCHSKRDSEAAEQDPEQRDSCCGLTLFHLLWEESKTSLETEDDLAIVYQYKFQTNEMLVIKT